MNSRPQPFAAAPELMQAFLEFSGRVEASGLERPLLELVKIRASQINGCANCLNMHTLDARAAGETEERIYLLSAWHEAPVYTDRERAALEWTEALTLLAQTRAPDAAYDAVKAQFTDAEIVKLTMVINAINAFNRLAVGFRKMPQA